MISVGGCLRVWIHVCACVFVHTCFCVVYLCFVNVRVYVNFCGCCVYLCLCIIVFAVDVVFSLVPMAL